MLIFLALATTCFGADLFVAADGSAEYNSVSSALWEAAPGDTVRIAAGVYDQESFPWFVGPDVVLAGAGADEVVVMAPNRLDNAGVEALIPIERGKLTVTGLSFDEGPDAVEGPDWFVVGQAGDLRLSDSSFLRLTRRAINSRSTRQPLLERTSLHIVTLSKRKAAALKGALNITDVFVEAETGGLWGMRLVGAQDLSFRVRRVKTINAAIEVQGSLSNVEVVGAGTGLEACVYAHQVSHATVVGCQARVAIFASRFADNNIVTHSDGAAIRAAAAARNILLKNRGGNFYQFDHSGQFGNVEVDPLFRRFSDDGDWSNDDFRLQEGSPAIDAASPAFPPTDLDGVPRPQDGDGDGLRRADIGAYEWGLVDEDGDGWFVEGGDCDDDDPDINPGVPDKPYNGVDEDCDGSDLTDVDQDGFDADHQGGDDCDDLDEDVFPGAWDIPNDGIDQDCDGADASDRDDDGWPDELDCAPDDPERFPQALELCNDLDDDCDGEIDEGDVCEDVKRCGCDATSSSWGWGLLALVAAFARRRRVG